MSVYRIFNYNKHLTTVELHNFFKILKKVSSDLYIEMTIVKEKVSIKLYSDREICSVDELLYPLKLEREESQNLKLKRYAFLKLPKFYNNLDKLHEINSLKQNRVTKILVKTFCWKYIPGYLCFGEALYENGNKEFLIIKNIVKFIKLEENGKLKYEKVPLSLRKDNAELKSKIPLLCSNDNSLGIDNFNYLKHSLIIGQSGVGKSKFIELICSSILTNNYSKDYSIIIIDPHKNIFLSAVAEPILDFDFRINSFGLFSNIGDPLTSTELSIDLLSSLLGNTENHYLYRVLKYSLLLLYGTKNMSLGNLQKLLTDLLFRKEILKQTEHIVLKDFFESEFVEISARHYSEAIIPILNLISEFSLIQQEGLNEFDLMEMVERNRVITISANIANLGAKITKLIDGAVIQELFTLVQSKALSKKEIILIVDEVSVIENPSLVKILSEARKFGLNVILSFQYLDQVSKELQNAIKSNIVNYFCFKVSKDDAVRLLDSINIEFDEKTTKGKKFEELRDKELKFLTSLNPREVIARVMRDEKYLLPAKLKTVAI